MQSNKLSERFKKINKNIEIPKDIQEMVDLRNKARADKNWEESDRLRDELMSKGYVVKDGKQGTVVEKLK